MPSRREITPTDHYFIISLWSKLQLIQRQLFDQIAFKVRRSELFHFVTKFSLDIFLLTAVQEPSENCSENALGMEYERIPDENITSSNTYSETPASHGRLGHPGGWCTVPPDMGYLQITLNTIFYICAVATQGRFEGNFVTTYQLQLSTSDNQWDFYRDDNTAEVSNFKNVLPFCGTYINSFCSTK